MIHGRGHTLRVPPSGPGSTERFSARDLRHVEHIAIKAHVLRILTFTRLRKANRSLMNFQSASFVFQCLCVNLQNMDVVTRDDLAELVGVTDLVDQLNVRGSTPLANHRTPFAPRFLI